MTSLKLIVSRSLPVFSRLTLVVFMLLFFSPATAFGEEETETDPLSVRGELSFTDTSGNSDSQNFAAALATSWEGAFNRFYLEGDYLAIKDDGETTTDKFTGETRYERVLTEMLFVSLRAGYKRDKFSGYDMRAYGGPGLGIVIFKNDLAELNTTLSVLFYHDEFADPAISDEEYGGAGAGLGFKWQIRENTSLKETASYSVNLEETDRFFLDNTIALEVKINSALSLGVSHTVNYQNAPPTDDIEKTDTTILTTLIVDF